MSRLRIGLFVGTLLFATAVPALAQQGTAEIAGKVTDEQGAVLPGVAIVVTNEETGIFREVITSEEGPIWRRSSCQDATGSSPSCPAFGQWNGVA